MAAQSHHLPDRRETDEAPLFCWKGASGQRYVHSVYPADAVPTFSTAVYVVARQVSMDWYEPLHIGRGDSDSLACALARGGALGPTHVHLHFLADGEIGRLTVEADLRRNYWAPLDRPAPRVRLAGASPTTAQVTDQPVP